MPLALWLCAEHRARKHDFENEPSALEKEIQQRALEPNDRVLLVDDWAEKGSQAIAAKRLIERRQTTFLGLAVMVDQLSDAQRDLLGEVRSIVRANELPADGPV